MRVSFYVNFHLKQDVSDRPILLRHMGNGARGRSSRFETRKPNLSVRWSSAEHGESSGESFAVEGKNKLSFMLHR